MPLRVAFSTPLRVREVCKGCMAGEIELRPSKLLRNLGGHTSHLRPCTVSLEGHPHRVAFSTPCCICEVRVLGFGLQIAGFGARVGFRV